MDGARAGEVIFKAVSSNANHAYIYLKIINCDSLLGFQDQKD